MDKKIIANNKKGYHDYFIEQKYEAGIELKGCEVKSIRLGKVSIKEAYIKINNEEAFVIGMNITPYEMANIQAVDPLRTRKLLLKKSEIIKLIGKTKEKGYTIIPLSIYLKNNLVKAEIGLARGKKLYDKRETIKRNDINRDVSRQLKNVNLR